MGSLRPKQIDFDVVWGDLKPAVINIINMQPISRTSWDNKSSDIYDICVSVSIPLTERLYKELGDCIRDHVANLRQNLSHIAAGELLKSYNSMWRVYYRGAIYLNRQHIKIRRTLDDDSSAQYNNFLQRPGYEEVGCMALDIWRDTLAKPLTDKLMMSILAAVESDRSGQGVDDRSIVHGVIMSFVEVEEFAFACDTDYVRQNKEFYERQFERKFLETTDNYYSNLAHNMMSSMPISAYVEKVISIIENERTRAAAIVQPSSIEKIIKRCQTVLDK